jgi:K+-transporting ATPase ATPase A chain
MVLMTINGLAQIGLFFLVLVALVKPLGWYMARVYTGQVCGMDRVIGPFERLIYRVCGVRATGDMNWKTYAGAMLLFNVTGLIALYALQRLQGFLPLNPSAFGAVAPDLAFNTASSFITNTNWQAYAGESTLSYLTQMLGLTVQNFVSAATAMAILVALIRGLTARSAATIGNFWVDLTRSTLYILLPLAAVLSLVLVSQGTVQTFESSHQTALLQPVTYDKPVVDAAGQPVLDEKDVAKTESATGTEQVLAVGPAASQVAIKHLGTNGGGFFNANAAHPYESPTPLTDFILILAETLIAASLTYTFGTMVGDTRQGWAILAAMLSVLVFFVLGAYWAESAGNPRLTVLGVEQTAGIAQPGGNMEGKEVRFGVGAFCDRDDGYIHRSGKFDA